MVAASLAGKILFKVGTRVLETAILSIGTALVALVVSKIRDHRKKSTGDRQF